MTISKFLGWCLLAFGPVLVGLFLVLPVHRLKAQPAAANITIAWICFDVLCSLVAGIWLLDKLPSARFWKIFLGCLVGFLLAALNAVLTFFAGCVLTL